MVPKAQREPGLRARVAHRPPSHPSLPESFPHNAGPGPSCASCRVRCWAEAPEGRLGRGEPAWRGCAPRCHCAALCGGRGAQGPREGNQQGSRRLPRDALGWRCSEEQRPQAWRVRTCSPSAVGRGRRTGAHFSLDAPSGSPRDRLALGCPCRKFLAPARPPCG